jgi:hypothetical protein
MAWQLIKIDTHGLVGDLTRFYVVGENKTLRFWKYLQDRIYWDGGCWHPLSFCKLLFV